MADDHRERKLEQGSAPQKIFPWNKKEVPGHAAPTQKWLSSLQIMQESAGSIQKESLLDTWEWENNQSLGRLHPGRNPHWFTHGSEQDQTLANG